MQAAAQAVGQRLPGCGLDRTRHAPVGHHLDGVLGQQQVDQHAIVVLGVPHAQLGEHHQRAFAHDAPHGQVPAQVPPQVAGGQARLDADAQLPGVPRLALGHAPAQALERVRRHQPARVRFVHPVMAPQAAQGGQHDHQLPLAPPPPKSPPPPELKPRRRRRSRRHPS
jgi:hypothetical protein